MKLRNINFQKIFIFLISFILVFLYILIFLEKLIFAAPPPSISSVDITATACASTISSGVTSARVGDTININGSNFGSSQGSSTVTINGSSPQNSNYTWSSSQIAGVVVPEGSITGSIDVVVGGKTASFSFTINPCITSISPTQADIGASVTINGNEFGSSPGTGNFDTSSNNISIAGVNVPTGDVSSWSNNQIIFTVPSGTTLGQDNLIVTAGGITSNTQNITIGSIPNNPASLSQSSVGGTLAANTYYYQVTALTNYGETTPSPSTPISITTTGSTSENTLSWNPVVGAVSYNVYRGVGSATMSQFINVRGDKFTDTGNVPWNNIGVGNWKSTLNMPANITNSGSVLYKGYVYEIGGFNGSVNLSAVYYSKINNNGTLLGWIGTTSLPNPTSGSVTIAYNGYLYEVGGYADVSGTNTKVATVYYAKINSDGSLGSWQTESNSLPQGLAFDTGVEYDGYIYVSGGQTPTSNSQYVYYSQIQSNGSIGAWSTSANELPTQDNYGSSVVYNGYIYIMGGNTGSGPSNVVYYTQIQSNANVGAWSSVSSTSDIPENIDSEASVVYDGYIFIFGGTTGSVTSAVYDTPINTNGTIGSWTNETPYSLSVENPTAVEYHGFVIIMGGSTSTGSASPVDKVNFSSLGVLPSANTAFTNTNQNNISWGAVSGATSYQIYRGTTSGGENTYFNINNGAETSFIDSGYNSPVSGSLPTSGSTAPTISSDSSSPIGGDILYGETYYYEVVATTSSGQTLPSSEVTITSNSTLPSPSGITISTSSISSTAISEGSWANHYNLSLGATISSPNSPDTLYLLVEVEPLGTAFTNSTTNFVTSGAGVYKSVAYSYSGTAIVANVEINNLLSNTEYHWQASVENAVGVSSWVAMGGNPDFGIDRSSPTNSNMNVLAFSSSPTSLFSNGFESGTILTSSSPAGGFTSDGGSSLPLIQNNIQGPVLQGNYSVNMTTSSGGTSYISNDTFNTSSAQIRLYSYISALSFASSSDSITIATVSGTSGTIVTLNILDTTQGPVLQTVNNVGSTSSDGTNVIPLNTWNVIILNLNINGTSGSVSTYLNSSLQTSLTSQNTGVSNMTTLTLGAVVDSTSDSINMNLDNINVQDTSGLTQLNYDNPSPYQYTSPYFEFLGSYDLGSGINNYGVYFGTNESGVPSSVQTTQEYSSSTLSVAGVYFLNIFVYGNNGSVSSINVDFEYNFYPPAGSSVPNAPTSLNQFQSNGTTAITNDTWTTSGISTNIVFQFSMSSPNSSDTLTPEIELEPNGTAFTGTPNYSGASVSYSGTAVTGIVDVTGLTNCTGYHWQAFVKNSAGLSSPTVFNSTTPNFSVSDTAPTPGSVYDGNVDGQEVTSTASISSIDSNWTGFSDTCSGLTSSPYQVEVGTTPGGNNIYSLSSTGVVLNNPSPYNTFSASSLPLHTGETYYVTVIATNNAGLTTSVTSSGQSVMPTLSFSINSNNVSLGDWNATNSYTTEGTTNLSVLTNAYNGYSVLAYESNVMQSITNSANTIANFSAGSYSSPASWGSGVYGFGYTSSCTDINGVNLFGSGTLFAPFTQTSPGDTVAQNSTNITGANYTGTPDTWTITYKVAVPANQAAGEYSTNIIYTVVSSF